MQVKEKNDLLQARFSANLAYVDQACDLVQEFLLGKGLDKQIFCVLLGLREALNNAVIHGCSQDQSLEVSLQVQLTSNVVYISVQDQGPGFDWDQALKKTVQENCEHGRGLCILRNYFHQVSFNPQGNKVELKLRLFTC
ncbi:MAG: ATP-binding protein [Thermodesulfobacteriota bacterium]